MSYAEDEREVEGTVNGVTTTTTGTRTLSDPHLQIYPVWGVFDHLHGCRCGSVSSLCCSVGLCPGGGSTGRPPEAGDSMHDEEGHLKQEEGFFSKLKKLFSSS